MKSRYLTILWDYATSMNTYDETYHLIAPVLKENKVVSYVEARKIGNKVFFAFTEDDQKTNDFFNTLIFTKKENLKQLKIQQQSKTQMKFQIAFNL